MNAYYTEKAVISLSRQYRVSYEIDGIEHTEDFSFPNMFEDAIWEIKQSLETRFGSPVNMIPSEFQKTLDDNRAKLENYIFEEDDSCPCCGK